MSKERIIRTFAAFFAVWYLICVVGFDIHTCRHSGESSVVSLVTGISCADIHPGHCGGCCGGTHQDACHNPDCISGQECCSNDIMFLDVTGLSGTEKEHHHHHFCSCLCGYCPTLADASVGILSDSSADIPEPAPDERSRYRDILLHCSVLRV